MFLNMFNSVVLCLPLFDLALTAIIDAPASLTNAKLNTTSSLTIECASGPYSPRRSNPKPIDCITLATAILATTTHHTLIKHFTREPDGRTTIFKRKAGSCELFLGLPYQNGVSITSEWASFDEILRAALEIMGSCLLNNHPEKENWGGVAMVGALGHLKTGIIGIKVGANDDPGAAGNGTLKQGFAPRR